MDFSKLDGLIPAVVQDHVSGEVLMVGFMNQEAWQRTRDSGYVTFFSRTRQTLWMKGETSGNRLLVRQVLLDCDEDTVLFKVRREGDGNVCHLNRVSCFVPVEPASKLGGSGSATSGRGPASPKLGGSGSATSGGGR